MRDRKAVVGEAVAAFVAEQLECPGWDARRAVGVALEGRIVGGVVFHEWWPEKGVVEVSIAASDPRWLDRRFLRFVGDYAFTFARLVVGRTSERNIRARRIWRRIGGQETVVPELWGEGEAGVILTLRKDAYLESPDAARGA